MGYFVDSRGHGKWDVCTDFMRRVGLEDSEPCLVYLWYDFNLYAVLYVV